MCSFITLGYFTGSGLYKLIHVTAFIRHGDRSPIYGLPARATPELSCHVRDLPEGLLYSEYVRKMSQLAVPEGEPVFYDVIAHEA